jgi:hypothetical protein
MYYIALIDKKNKKLVTFNVEGITVKSGNEVFQTREDAASRLVSLSLQAELNARDIPGSEWAVYGPAEEPFVFPKGE